VLQELADAAAPRGARLAAEARTLAARRAELVAGRTAPEPSELEGLEEDAEAAAAAGSAGSGKSGVPFFWASVFHHCDVVSEHVSRRDACALEYLRDVRPASGLSKGARGVELVFDPRVGVAWRGGRGGGA
jgi:hypothetical protein